MSHCSLKLCLSLFGMARTPWTAWQSLHRASSIPPRWPSLKRLLDLFLLNVVASLQTTQICITLPPVTMTPSASMHMMRGESALRVEAAEAAEAHEAVADDASDTAEKKEDDDTSDSASVLTPRDEPDMLVLYKPLVYW